MTNRTLWSVICRGSTCSIVALAALSFIGSAMAAPGDTQLISAYVDSRIRGTAHFDLGGLTSDARFITYGYHGLWMPAGSTETEYTGEIFLVDRSLGATAERISVTLDGRGANASGGSLSSDGRYVAFTADGANLTPIDTNPGYDVYVRDRQSGITELVSVDSYGVQGMGWSYRAVISANGRYVAFRSAAALVDTDINLEGNNPYDIYVHDRWLHRTELVSVNMTGVASGGCATSSMTPDGRFVTFVSYARDLVPGDTNEAGDVFVRDRQLGTTERVSVSSSEREASIGGYGPTISADGRYVAFLSRSWNLVPGDTNRQFDVFVRDRHQGTTRRINLAPDGSQANGPTELYDPSISADGGYVTYGSSATNLVIDDTNGAIDAFVTDIKTGRTVRASVNSDGIAANGRTYGSAISGDGRFVAFKSVATNLVKEPWDAGGADVYLHELAAAPAEVIYDFYLRPLAINFGEVLVGTAVTKGFTLANSGSAALPLNTVAIKGYDRSAYSFKSYCGSTVPVGKWCWIAVTFRPAAPGAAQANLLVVAGGIERHRALAGSGFN